MDPAAPTRATAPVPTFEGPDVAPGLLAQWYVVADAVDVAAAPVAVRVLGRSFVLWRDDAGEVCAAVDRCPHREAPLSAGTVHDGCLVCPYHGWVFDADGACTTIPSAPPGSRIPTAARLTTVAVEERYGLVWLRPGPAATSVGIPLIVEDDDETFGRWNSGTETWSASATRMTDNFCDVAHFPYVHAGTIGAGTDPVVAGVEIEQLGGGFVGYRYHVDVLDESGRRIGQDMSTAFHLPFVVRSNTRYTSGPRAGQDRVLLLCSTPVDDRTSLFSFVVWRNHDHDRPADEVLAFDRAIGAEDRTMLERIPGHLALDDTGAAGTTTVSVRSDRLSVRWRTALRDLLRPRPGADSST